jgi:hypothetical protein|tara:strand:+ start:318 stop:446 length:129 start_codon:yes stop_codon:yes gene_type:complete
MIILEYIYYKLKNIDAMYYETLAYAIITGLVCGGLHYIIGLF